MKNKMLKVLAGVVACVSLAVTGSYCYNSQFSDLPSAKGTDMTDPIIYTEVSHFDTLYNFSDSKVLAEHSDLIVVGKITDIGNPTNFNPITKKYGKTRTPGELEVMQVIKSDGNTNLMSIEFMDIGGILPYNEYSKGLLPAQKAKREYLMEQSGLLQSRNNIYIDQVVENQLELEEDKNYIMYLYYNEDFGKYMVVNQPYGIKEYNENTGKVLNHVTNEVASLQELM